MNHHSRQHVEKSLASRPTYGVTSLSYFACRNKACSKNNLVFSSAADENNRPKCHACHEAPLLLSAREVQKFPAGSTYVFDLLNI